MFDFGVMNAYHGYYATARLIRNIHTPQASACLAEATSVGATVV